MGSGCKPFTAENSFACRTTPHSGGTLRKRPYSVVSIFYNRNQKM